jgi:hypothetical protein
MGLAKILVCPVIVAGCFFYSVGFTQSARIHNSLEEIRANVKSLTRDVAFDQQRLRDFRPGTAEEKAAWNAHGRCIVDARQRSDVDHQMTGNMNAPPAPGVLSGWAANARYSVVMGCGPMPSSDPFRDDRPALRKSLAENSERLAKAKAALAGWERKVAEFDKSKH